MIVRYHRLGQTDLLVSAIGLGTTFFAGEGVRSATRTVGAALNEGMNYFDTAPLYLNGRGEELLGRALKGRRAEIVLSTKLGYLHNRADHRHYIALRRQLERSLRRLRTDYVDILAIHEADFAWWWRDRVSEEGCRWPFELIAENDLEALNSAPVLRVVQEALKKGTARFFGLTGKNACRLHWLARQLQPDVVMIAHQYNLLLRTAETGLLPSLCRDGVGVTIGAPLMRGWLATPQQSWIKEWPQWMDSTFYEAYKEVLELAQENDMELAELALRWYLGDKRIHCVVVGFSDPVEVSANSAYVRRGSLPGKLQESADRLGIIHPLIYQGRKVL